MKMYLVQMVIVVISVSNSIAQYSVLNQTKQEVHPKCTLLFYSTTCLKLDLLRLMAHLGKKTKLDLLTGVTMFTTQRTKNIIYEIDKSAEHIDENNVDNFVLESALKYLGSLNITVQLDQTNLLPDVATLQNEVFTGRKRNRLYTIGTVAAVGFALLAALTGKALMASMLALALSALSAFRGGGGFGHGGHHHHHDAAPAAYGKVTQYDIITRPIVSSPHHEPDHHFNSYIDSYTTSGRHLEVEADKRKGGAADDMKKSL